MKTYVICGLSSRGIAQFALPLIGHPKLPEYGDFSAHGKLVGILDLDRERVEAFNGNMGTAIPFFPADAFDRMIVETNPDVVVVASSDVHHAAYIIAALGHNRNVITEKPMVIDGCQARAVIEAERASLGRVRVAHNFRYTPLHRAIKRILLEGSLGRIVQVQMTYLLDTFHGSSYFYRWHRDRSVSGGLSVTKSCHHFDLLNWWLDDIPVEVFAFGERNSYGPDSPHIPSRYDCRQMPVATQKEFCPYHKRWNEGGVEQPKDDHLEAYAKVFSLPMNVQYPHPMWVYDEEIEIEDTYSAAIRYKGGASVNYSLNASSPWEGYILGIQGTHGRLETTHYVAPARCPFPVSPMETITCYPLFGQRQIHDVARVEGGHGGADEALRREMFVGACQESEELLAAAGTRDGALAVAVGEGVWRSVAEKKPIGIMEILGGEVV
ncbi:MAG TPA: Gfo/Idh/MocA family oxidoreductase [Terrimicrobiaceae bacterium]|nr:Gfo/Idh/MocA family oxidoreductase [Terrimicrobiaceae bacterium]